MLPCSRVAFRSCCRDSCPRRRRRTRASAKIDELGASYTASGLGDLAIYEGRLSDAVTLFTKGAAADLQSNDPDRAANKFAALAYSQVLRGQMKARWPRPNRRWRTAMRRRSDSWRRGSSSRRTRSARAHARRQPGLGASSGAAGVRKIIEGDIALKGGDARQAAKSSPMRTRSSTPGLATSIWGAPTWSGRFHAGRFGIRSLHQAPRRGAVAVPRRGAHLRLLPAGVLVPGPRP